MVVLVEFSSPFYEHRMAFAFLSKARRVALEDAAS